VEAEGAGGQKLLRGWRAFWTGFFDWLFGRADEDFESAAFDFFGFAGIDDVARRQDEGARGEDFGLPMVEEAEIDDGDDQGWASPGTELIEYRGFPPFSQKTRKGWGTGHLWGVVTAVRLL
jgi:hypothetical protein